MTSPLVVVPERSQLYGMWVYLWVVSPSNLSLFWDDQLVPWFWDVFMSMACYGIHY